MRQPTVLRREDRRAVDAPVLTLTIDLEDHRPVPTWPARYPDQMRRWLDHCDERGIRATVFVVGAVAHRSPELVVEIARRGHEIGLHNFDHWALFSCRPESFGPRVAAERVWLEELTGTAVVGFRAPAGTLVPSTVWATEALLEAGFTYSASALPAQTYGVGFPGCPSTPFRWPSGLAELPCPVVAAGGVGLPFLGGTFLRVLPLPVVRRLAADLPTGSVPWVYGHPYDVDVLEPVYRVEEVGRWGTVLLWLNRGRMFAKVDAVLGPVAGAPLAERLAGLGDELPVFDPVAAPSAGSAVTGHVARVLRRDHLRRRLAAPGALVDAADEAATGNVDDLAPAS
ncbi:MAG: DUF3473 domain-containing protein [Acidimicrobiales bacterium]